MHFDIKKWLTLRFFLFALCGIAIGFGVLAFGLFVHEAAILPGPWFDDAYMYIRYSENVNAGNGYCWNYDQSPIFGCTDIIYVYLIAFTKKAIPALSYEQICIWWPVVNYGIFLLILIYSLIRFCSNGGRLVAFIISALVAVCMTANQNIIYHLFTGMDTILSLTVNTLLIVSLLVLEEKRRVSFALAAAFMAYLSWLIRPDNIFYAALFPALFMAFRFKGDFKIQVAFFSSFLLLVIADLFFKYHYFGEVLPLSFYVKSGGFFDGYMGEADWNPFSYLLMFLRYGSVWLLLLFAFAEHGKRDYYAIFFTPLLITLIYYFGAVQIMGTAARFYLPSLPFLIFPAVISLFKRESSIPLSGLLKMRLVPVSIMVLLLLLAVFADEPLSSAYSKVFLQNRKPYLFAGQLHYNSVFPVYTDEYPDFNDLCKKLPANTVIAASEDGHLAADNPQLRIVDLAGLHEPYFAHHGFSAERLMDKKPSLIQLAHYNITKVNADIVENEVFKKEYDFYPNLYTYGVAVRKSDTVVCKIFEKELHNLFDIDSPQTLRATLR